MLDFFQKFLCGSKTTKHRSSSSHFSEKKRPVQKFACEKCGRELLPSLYETHKTMYCKGVPSAVRTSSDPAPKKEVKPKTPSHDVSMEVSRREEVKEKKKLPEKNQMTRSQVYRHDGDKSIMTQSVSSVRVATSRSRLEQRKPTLEPIVRPRSEVREISKSVKIETPSSKSDQISQLVSELQPKSIAERQPLELKFIQEHIEKKSINEYAVSESWISKYKEYLNGNLKSLPGPIVNQKTATISKDRYAVNETVWKFISKLYGGGPEIVFPNRSISISASESDKSEPMTADTMSAHDSVRTSTSLKPFLKKTNFFLKPIGMANESFYCYMNSCLQGLLSIGEIAQYASEEKYKSASSKNPKFWKAMNEVVASHGKRTSCTNPKAVRRISANMFDPDEQHDAHEFLRFLVSGMQDEINLARPKKQVEINDPDTSWAYYRKYNVSIVDELFAGQLVNRVLCTACNHLSTTFDPFLDLSLPITPGKTNNLDDCLEAFQQEEEIKDSYVCEKCKSKSRAIKRLVVNKFPRYLVIHLKRFQTYPRKRKIIDQINFQMDNWSIKKVFGKEVQTYSLVASIIHRGSFDSGHYTCYSKRNGEWVLCDDETVRSASAKEVANKEAYVLVYERKC